MLEIGDIPYNCTTDDLMDAVFTRIRLADTTHQAITVYPTSIYVKKLLFLRVLLNDHGN